MISQKHLFDLPEAIHYLNGAYMSPLMKLVQEAGISGIRRKANPASFTPADFFTDAEAIKRQFGALVNADPIQVAIIPSASYGLKSAINNIPLHTGSQAITVAHEFPSDYYTLQEWCKKNDKQLKVIAAPGVHTGRGATWTESILESITLDTAAVVMSTIHWTDGTKFDLKKIGEKCKSVDALFIVDGTQSVGALPIDVTDCRIDALVCAAYKWLLGPYSSGVAYYSAQFNDGIPIEDSWMNRSNAHDFTKLTNYVSDFGPGATRYNVGEFSNPILLPMMGKALDQLLEWGVDAIQGYSGKLVEPLLQYLQKNGCWVEEAAYRANHLFGFLLPASVNKTILLQELQNRKVMVSIRGDAIRVSTSVYNTEKDIEALIEVLDLELRAI